MRCYSHLSDDEREQIGLAKAVGHSIGAIAKAIGRPKSTVSRELLRNGLPSGRYSPLHAAGAYQLRRRREALIERDRALRTFVVDRLAEGWAPEQISGWLKGGNEPRLRAVGCETIYAFIYRTAQQAEQLWRLGNTNATVGSLPVCCARATSGHATTTLPRSVRNLRRLIAAPKAQEGV